MNQKLDVGEIEALFGGERVFASDVARVWWDGATGQALLILKMEGRANKINARFGEGLAEAMEATRALSGLKGIVLASGHRDFCVGADLEMLYGSRDAAALYSQVRSLSALFRSIEQGVPVACALTGTALGGGYELALSCHYRAALDSPELQVGLPEVNLGVIPGSGGTQRLPRLIGIQGALENIAQAKILRASEAASAGMLDSLAPDVASLLEGCRGWLAKNPGRKQPWDSGDFVWPAPAPNSEEGRNIFMVGCAMLYQKTNGVFPAAEAAISVVQQGSSLQFDRALEVEARRFVQLAVSDQAKDMIRTFFFHRSAAERHEGLPTLAKGEDAGIRKVAILGAGMMGAGLAFLCASRGYEVVLKDITAPALEAGMAHVRTEAERVGKRKGAAAAAAILEKVTGTLENAPIAGTDLVIEAVIEDMKIKHRVTRELEPLLSPNAIWASNTSALPITALAEASAHPDRFVGLHFFSPVEKMPLLEIIHGDKTSENTLARSLAFCRSIKKLPILVNDGYGFYTSRVFASYLLEGVQMVAEGIDPVLVEWAARSAGMVVPPLQVFDEVSLRLGRHVLEQAAEYTGRGLPQATALLVALVDQHGRLGKVNGKGFYDYTQGSRGYKRTGIWTGLTELTATRQTAEVPALARRLLLAQCAEVARCFDEGILRQYRDAEVGAIFGIGFAPNTGGPLAWMDRQGIPALVAELEALAALHGERFVPATKLREMAAKGERFFD